MMGWYVYIYFQPWDGQPCYVGKGKGIRWLKHEQAGVNHRNPFFAEVFATAHAMNVPLIKIKVRECLSEDEAFTTEVALIRTIGRLGLGTGPLVNLTDGGEGMSGHVPTESTRKKRSASLMGHSVSENVRTAVSRANTGRIPWNKGVTCGPMLPEQAEKIRVALTGRVFSEEHRRRLGEKSKGRHHSAESKEKIREAALARRDTTIARNLGNTWGSLTKGKKRPPNPIVAEANRNRVHTEESRKARSEQCKARWADPVYSEKNLRKIFNRCDSDQPRNDN